MPDEMDFEKALARYVRFHRQHVSDPLPDPPAEWKDLTGEFARILTESTPPPRQRFGWWTLAGIAAVAAAGVYVLELRQAAPPPVTKQPAIAPIEPNGQSLSHRRCLFIVIGPCGGKFAF